MHKLASMTVLALALIPSAICAAPDAQSVLQAMQDKKIERWEGVDTYVVARTVMGQRATMCYRRVEVVAADKKASPVFVPMSHEECYGGGQASTMTADDYDNMGNAYEMAGQGMGNEIESRMTEMGLPPGLLAATGSDPWATMDPRVMFGGAAKMFRDVATHKREAAANPEDPAAELYEAAVLSETARLVGTEKIDGRRAYHVRVDDMNNTQVVDGREIALHEANLWIDTEWLVPVRTKLEGVMTTEGKSQPLTIEKVDSDYRAVPGSQMFEPYRQVSKITGLMDEAQQQEMENARRQLAEMDAQMASMSPAQRAQMESMMGGQLDMVRQMAEGGGFTSVMVTDEILVNPDPEALRTAQQGGMFGSAMPAAMAAPRAAPPVAATAPAAPMTQGSTTNAQDQAEKACLQQKIAAAQEAQKTKRGLGRLFSGISRVARRVGGSDVANGIAQTTAEVNNANATAADLSAAAKDLGLTEGDIASCKRAK